MDKAATFMPVGMVVTDLDGTLLGSERQLSAADRQTLVHLGRLGVARVGGDGPLALLSSPSHR